jgi:hypothetical protein
MKNSVNSLDPCDPVEAYVRPIRSVLFIDDQFPTFAQAQGNETTEVERARALWKACVDQGWLCDIDNTVSWDSKERQRRLASSDLLVLDYHLVGNDSGPTLTIIRDLARSATPNLVVLYTKDPKLNDVLLAAASWSRGVGPDTLLPADLEDIEDSIEWTLEEHVTFLSNAGDWKASLRAACENAGVDLPDDASCIALIERKLRRDHGVAQSPEIRWIDKIGYKDNRWFQCGNLFLVVVGKSAEKDPASEAAELLACLEDAVRQWNPTWLACLMAHSRRLVDVGAFRDDVLLPDDALQNGLWGYISDPTSDPPERMRRATEVGKHLLSRRSADAAKALGKHLHDKAEGFHRNESSAELELLHLNTFLCSESFSHHHLHVGTIFVYHSDKTQYWVCVTPACDLVPRKPNEGLNPWAAELHTFKPITALRLKRLLQPAEKKRALKEAHRGRYLFFWDPSESSEQPLVTASFRDTADPNPWLEQLLARDQAQMREDGSVELYRYFAPKDEAGLIVGPPELRPIVCKPVAQLRAPYAERIVQVVGGHISRIGVDFVSLK